MKAINFLQMSVAIGALTISSVLLPCLQQDQDPITCSHIEGEQELSIAVLNNRIQQMRLELELSEQQVSKLTVGVKRIARDQLTSVFEFRDLESHSFFRGNPLKSQFWKTMRDKVLTEEQSGLLQIKDDAVVARVLATAINSKEALKSPEAMSEFYLARWKRDARFTEKQVKDVKPLLKAYLGQPGVDTMDSSGFIPELEASDLLTDSQLALFKGVTNVGQGPVWGESWSQTNCAECHRNE